MPKKLPVSRRFFEFRVKLGVQKIKFRIIFGFLDVFWVVISTGLSYLSSSVFCQQYFCPLRRQAVTVMSLLCRG